jgi:hypothetical protein
MSLLLDILLIGFLYSLCEFDILAVSKYRVHTMLVKSLKVLEFVHKNSRFLKVLEKSLYFQC